MSPSPTRAVILPAILAAALSAPEARQSGAGVPSKPILPVAASTLASNPDPYYGEPVSVTGAVERSLSRLAFSIDQDRKSSAGAEVLVLARRLNSPVTLNTYVTVIGEVVRFQPDEIAVKAKDFTPDLPPDVAATFRGKPTILATAVINTAGVDLAMRLPPPMTPDEEAHAKIMKQVGPANAALRKAVEAMDGKLAGDNAAVLRQAFVQTGDFWKSRGRPDAASWAQDARKLAEAIERAAVDNKWDDVKTSAGELGKACQACHAAYRERFDDGSYRFKSVLQPRFDSAIRNQPYHRNRHVEPDRNQLTPER